VNGDGLVDLVTMNVDDSSGVARVRPATDAAPFVRTDEAGNCVASGDDSYYEIVAPGGADWPWAYALSHNNAGVTPEAYPYLHDVTGDGLADLVFFDALAGPSANLKVWVNIDGTNFACVGQGPDRCVVGNLNRSYASGGGTGFVGWADDTHGGSYFVGFRLAFADMNADAWTTSS